MKEADIADLNKKGATFGRNEVIIEPLRVFKVPRNFREFVWSARVYSA